jgi:hypothetical protein
VAEILQPENMATYLRSLERRVAALESSGRPSQIPMDVTVWGATESTASADWTPLYDLRLDVVVGPAFRVGLAAYTDVGTFGQWRFQITNITGTPVSDTVAAVSATPGNTVLILTNSDNLVYGAQNIRIEIQARVTTGGGSVYLYRPFLAWNGISIATAL